MAQIGRWARVSWAGMGEIVLDNSQVAALERALSARSTVIAGAAGTGKTRVLLEAVSRIVETNQTAVVLASGRRAADDLRARLTTRLGRLPEGLAVRTAQAWAFTILQQYAADRHRQTPELITGPAQDAIIGELLVELGDDIPWPKEITPEVMELPGFRAELRDLLTRAAELGLQGSDLARLGRQQGEEMWVAAGELIDQYESALALEDATAMGGGGADRFDHARLVHQAARLLSAPDAWSDGAMPHSDWIIVDDYQNATLATAALLSASYRAGTRLILAADPDTAVEGFRGGIAHLPGLAKGSRDGLGFGAEVVALRTRHRAGEHLSRIQDALCSRIGVAGMSSHRNPRPAGGEDSVSIKTFASVDQQLSGIARIIRHKHVRGGLSYDDIAVITRARSAHTELERVLADAGVKVRPAAREQPLRYVPIVRALIDVVREANGDELDDATLLNVLASPLVGIEPQELRSLRRRLAAWATEHDTVSPVRHLVENAPAERWAAPVRRLRTIVASARAAVVDGGNAESVLWAAWHAAGRAEEWRTLALAGGVRGRAANAMLDAVMTMFRAAQRMVDRDGRASSIELVQDLEAQEFAEDSIARTGREAGVHLLTPAMAVGLEFDLVIVADLNDGVWPNLRARDGLFGAGRLAELYLDRLTDGVSVRSVLDDELRMLAAAAGRAKQALVLTAVDSEETSRSRFIDLIADENDIDQVDASELSMSVPGIVGRLRSVLSDPELGVGEKDREAAAAILASLPQWTDVDIAGVDPHTWVPALEPSTDAVWRTDLRLSPSAVEDVAACPLRWFMSSRGFSDTDDRRRLDIGTLIHELAESYPNGGRDELLAAFEEKWTVIASTMEDGLEKTTEYDRVRSMVESLAVYLAASPPADVEQSVRVDTEAFTVSGRIDRVEHSERGPVIVDFKTSDTARPAAVVQDNPQLKIYQWAYERAVGVPVAGARLVYPAARLAKGNPSLRVQDPLTDDDRKAVDDLLASVQEDLSGSSLAARTNEWCTFCAVKAVCPLYDEGALFS
ncbi:UrvD/REP family ATP-dependent DNA helicase [Flaviflexus huanghaiensis]|uniref:UrvD/REP family ATP-dependent DNA helicase n=1 Tax=Flaviflexus huanghaiensis TaxID=1111473 RepID=UPI0015FD627E|nr:UrvD/REP family ATP-dependent DNA helicase [Flaviflexus huanghaiensis]